MPQPTNAYFELAANADFFYYVTFKELGATGKLVKKTDGEPHVFLADDLRSETNWIEGTITYFGDDGAVKKWVARWESSALAYETVHPLFSENGGYVVTVHPDGSKDVRRFAYVDDREAAVA